MGYILHSEANLPAPTDEGNASPPCACIGRCLPPRNEAGERLSECISTSGGIFETRRMCDDRICGDRHSGDGTHRRGPKCPQGEGALQAVLGLNSRNHFKIHLVVRAWVCGPRSLQPQQ